MDQGRDIIQKIIKRMSGERERKGERGEGRRDRRRTCPLSPCAKCLEGRPDLECGSWPLPASIVRSVRNRLEEMRGEERGGSASLPCQRGQRGDKTPEGRQ